jgi:predicted MFS family arabinose efflux permease
VQSRARAGAYLAVLLSAAGLFGVFFFLTYYMQLTFRFSPLTAGLAFLPMTGLLVATSVTVKTRVLPRTGTKPVVIIGMTLGVIAMIIFSRLTNLRARGEISPKTSDLAVRGPAHPAGIN